MGLEDQVNISTSSNPSESPLAGSDLDVKAKQAAYEKQAVEADAQARSKPVTEALGAPTSTGADAGITNKDLFPGMNQPINVGSSSSQTLGTQPIFVASGQYLPLNVLNKKEAAIEKAAQARTARQMKFDPGKAAKLNNPLYQQELNDQFGQTVSDFMAEAKSLHGQNFDLALGSQSTDIGRRFATAKRNMATMAEQQNVVFDRVAEVRTSKEQGGPTRFSADATKHARDLENRLGEFAEGKDVDVTEAVDKFYGSYDLDQFLNKNKVLSSVLADIESEVQNGGDYFEVIKQEKYARFIDEYPKTLTGQGEQYEGDELITEDVIRKNLEARLGRDAKVESKIKMKPKITAGERKEKGETDRVKLRSRNLTKTIEDPKSDIGRIVTKGAIGTPFKRGTISKVTVLDSDDWAQTEEKQFNPLMTKLNGFRSRFDNEPFFTKGNVITEVKKSLKESGLEGVAIGVSYKGGENSNVFNIKIDGKEVELDIDNKESVSEFEDLFMTGVHGGSDFKDRSVVVTEISNAKGKLTSTERLSTDDPEWVAVTNSVLNKNAGQDKQVELDKVLERMGMTSSDGAPAAGSFEEYQGTPTYQAVLDQAKLDHPNASEEKIIESIKGGYKPK